jgi:hypothetical protein
VLNGCFKSSAGAEVLFLSKESVAGSQVLAAGTSDNRLLLWVGCELMFQQVAFHDPYVIRTLCAEQSALTEVRAD